MAYTSHTSASLMSNAYCLAVFAQVPNRAGHVMAIWKGAVVVHGGQGYYSLNDVMMLDLTSFVWSELTGAETMLRTGHIQAFAVVYGNRLMSAAAVATAFIMHTQNP
jgi:hypothetical protein